MSIKGLLSWLCAVLLCCIIVVHEKRFKGNEIYKLHRGMFWPRENRFNSLWCVFTFESYLEICFQYLISAFLGKACMSSKFERYSLYSLSFASLRVAVFSKYHAECYTQTLH